MKRRELITSVLVIDEPSEHTGRVFPLDVVEDMVNGFRAHAVPVFGTMGKDSFNEDEKLQDLSHEITDLNIRNGILFAHVKVLETPSGNILQEMIGSLSFFEHFYLAVGGMGKIDDNNVVTEFELRHINVAARINPEGVCG